MSSTRSAFLSWPLLVFVLVTVAVLLSGERPLIDGDTYMHIGIGDWIIAHQTVPKVDVFSHTMAGQPWMAHEWLAEAILSATYRFAGWTGLVLLAGLCTAATLALMLRFMLSRMIPLYALGFAALTYLALQTHLLARPHVLTWPLIVLWVTALLNAVERRRMPPWWLLAVMGLWVNLHGGFILGFALLGPIMLEAVLQIGPVERPRIVMRWLGFAGAALLASLLNPAGWDAYRFLWHLMSNDYLTHVSEWQPTDLSRFGALEVWIYALIAMGMLGMLRLPGLRLLLLLGLLYQALAHVRYVSVFALLAPLFLALPFGCGYQRWQSSRSGGQTVSAEPAARLDDWFARLSRPAGVGGWLIGLGLIAGFAWFSHARAINDPGPGIVPQAAVDAMQASGMTGKVFNTYGAGGYLIMRGIPAYADGRADLYGADFMRQHAALLASNDLDFIRSRLDAAGVDWAILSASANLSQQLMQLTDWQEIYTDNHAKLFQRVKLF